MRQILFVDDESHLLDGLRRMLRSMRREWEMEFAPGPEEALSILKHKEFDVVVSDVRMPVMNGVELLTHVKNQYPHTIRILLSGQSDEETALSAIGPVHQYLSKPCDADVLINTIDRVCGLGDLLNNEALKKIVSQVDAMPALPDLYQELEEELQSSDSSIDKVAEIIAKDIGMTAQILKIVNSAFFGLQKTVVDPKQAVLYLGIDTVKTLVLTIQVFEQMSQQLFEDFNMENFWQHTCLSGEIARKIMLQENAEKQMIEETLTAAMLHDLGTLLLAAYFPENYQQCLAISKEQDISITDAEYQILGTSHAEVGAYLLGLWGLATPIVEAVAFHHLPVKCLHRELSPLTAIHATEVLLTTTDNSAGDSITQIFDMKYLEEVGVQDSVDSWQSFTEEEPA